MAKQNTKSAINDIQSLFDPQGYQNAFKTWAQTGEHMTAITTEAAVRSTDIASDSAKEAFTNLRERLGSKAFRFAVWLGQVLRESSRPQARLDRPRDHEGTERAWPPAGRRGQGAHHRRLGQRAARAVAGVTRSGTRFS